MYSSSRAASEAFMADSERGWFWYEEPVEEEQIEAAESPESTAVIREKAPEEHQTATVVPQDFTGRSIKVADIDENSMDRYIESLPRTPGGTLFAKDLKEILPKSLELAVDNPSSVNVLRYFTLQRMTMNKSENFATESRRLVMLSPELDEMGGAVRPLKLREEAERKEERELASVLADLREKVILVYVYQGSCPYCRQGVSEINILADEGFRVVGISLDGIIIDELKAVSNIHEPSAASYYGISSVPALLAVDADERGGSGYSVVMSNGLLNLSEIRFRLAEIGK
jgi:conjugal transfer pilus assembly protein TraF